MKRKNKEHCVKILLDGYELYEMDLIRTVDRWVVGNVLIGGIIGLAVDAVSGSMYKLTPKFIKAEF
jgi:hypothetical protein